jgi:hypothetical protein
MDISGKECIERKVSIKTISFSHITTEPEVVDVLSNLFLSSPFVEIFWD